MSGLVNKVVASAMSVATGALPAAAEQASVPVSATKAFPFAQSEIKLTDF